MLMPGVVGVVDVVNVVGVVDELFVLLMMGDVL
jgi:hypothetical protein